MGEVDVAALLRRLDAREAWCRRVISGQEQVSPDVVGLAVVLADEVAGVRRVVVECAEVADRADMLGGFAGRVLEAVADGYAASRETPR